MSQKKQRVRRRRTGRPNGSDHQPRLIHTLTYLHNIYDPENFIPIRNKQTDTFFFHFIDVLVLVYYLPIHNIFHRLIEFNRKIGSTDRKLISERRSWTTTNNKKKNNKNYWKKKKKTRKMFPAHTAPQWPGRIVVSRYQIE